MTANHAVLLVMDVQNGIVQRFAGKSEGLTPFQLAVSAARGLEFPLYLFVSHSGTVIQKYAHRTRRFRAS